MVYSCRHYVVWCPKYRRKVLVNGVDVRLKAMIEEVCNEYCIDIIEMEIMPDHVHLSVIKQYIENQKMSEFNSVELWMFLVILVVPGMGDILSIVSLI